MSKAFNGAANAPPRAITTKAELDARVESRPTPKPEPALTPNTWEAAGVNQAVNRLAEMRITELKQRLQSSRDMLERDHTLSRLHGKPRADFGKNHEHLKVTNKSRAKAGVNSKAQNYER